MVRRRTRSISAGYFSCAGQAQHHDRRVVLRCAAKRANVGEHPIDDSGGVGGFGSVNGRHQPIVTELGPVRRAGFGNAVGEENQAVAGRSVLPAS